MTSSSSQFRDTFELSLQGLAPAPSQVWGAVRLVPLIREVPLEDLRLGSRQFTRPPLAVTVKGTPHRPRVYYGSYIPYGLVVSWTDDGHPVVQTETWLGREGRKTGRSRACDFEVFPRRSKREVLHRMVKRESATSFRMLPLHLAMEGYLSLHFGGPDIAWDTWSQESLRWGLSPRVETSVPGFALPDLGDALRLFEIHENQCGVLLFCGDSFASGFAVPHPEDYRALHTSLLQDFYGELLYYHGWLNREVPAWSVELDGHGVASLDELARAYEAARAAWAGFDAVTGTQLLGRTVRAQPCRQAGPYALQRFITDLAAHGGNHIGEIMTHRDGTVAYLKTYRLSDQQTQRVRLLQSLADHDWILADAARSLGHTELTFKRALVAAGFGGLLSKKIRARL